VVGERAVLGIDIGGTKLRIGLVDRRLELLDFLITEEHRFATPQQLVDLIAENVTIFLRRNPEFAIMGIGVGYPGPVNFSQGSTFSYSNLLCEEWEGVPLASMLTERLGFPVVLDNDANLAGLAEMYLGAARDFSHWVYLTISTGLGGAIFIDRRLYRGFLGNAGEFGHMVVDLEGKFCKCGNRGCLMSLLSGLGMERFVQEEPSCRLLFAGEDGSDCVRRFVELASSRNPTAQEAFRPFLAYLKVTFLNLIQILNPQGIVVGGSLGKALWRAFGDQVKQHLKSTLPVEIVSQTVIREAKLGDQGGVLGGAVLAFEELKKRGGEKEVGL
jgi:glucokinase